MNKIKIIATIGPESNNPDTLSKLKDRGASFFRINLSHTEEDEIEKRILDIKSYGIPIILDTEGSQVRSGNTQEIEFIEGDTIRLYDKRITCDSKNIWLNPVEVASSLRETDLISIDFNSLLIKVFNTENLEKEGYIDCKVLIGAKIGGKKAVHISSDTFKLPAFSKKDLKAIEIAKKYGIKHFTLSFMECKDSVNYFRNLYPEAVIYSKIESKKGLENFEQIAQESDGILIDRGDLSSQVNLEKIPFIQKHIIAKCRLLGKEVFVATNTLEQMSFSLKPNRAEVNDIINTVLDGATGIALTKEIAAGKYPIETINMISLLLKQIEFVQENSHKDIIDKIEKSDYLTSNNVPELLVKPHGGKLIERVSNEKINLPDKKLTINEEILMDVEQIAVGAFSPLEGFMCKDDFNSVVDNMHLSNGIIWPLPIILQVDESKAKEFNPGENISLVYNADNQIYAILHLDEIYQIDKHDCAKKIYATDSLEHPGVKSFIEKGGYLLGGKITLVKRRNSPYKIYELTPKQTRKIFSERGWSKVVGFHTRNVIHKSHEFIQLEGLKQGLCDGLFVHPIIGKKKQGDFEADMIIKSYELMIDKFYPKNKVLLSAFASYSRYCGPREALFTALVRKNFGCSHFIVGRDHTGVGNFYHPNASHKIFNEFSQEELGIIPIKFDNVLYFPEKHKYVHINNPEGEKIEDFMHISGTQAREIFKSGNSPPEWFMRPEISELILKALKNNEKVFV
ncbi:MAG: sulfate adenylyltransferase [Candidatus Pacearchaeota archaeon]|jgi:ATP sulfurylase